MRLIIGGANQGKADFAVKKYGLSPPEIADGETVGIRENLKFKCVKNYHFFIKKLLENGENPIEFTAKIIAENPDIIVIMNEIGGGIIPIEKAERIWREQVGIVGCMLAENAESVERIVCGICTKIK